MGNHEEAIMTTKTINIYNKIVSYNITGSGKPVILLHGFGEDSMVWQHQVNFLREAYKIITPDIPGSGASALTDDVSMDGIAYMVKTIAEKEGIEKFVLIGHSMGGYATLAFVEKYTPMLKGFGLFHSSAYADSEEKKQTRKKGIEFIKEHGTNEFLQTVTPNLFSDITKEQNAGFVKTFIQSLPEFPKLSLIEYYKGMMQRPDRTAVLSQTSLPVLFIIGQHDKAVPYEDSLKQSSLPATSFITILNNSAHMGMLEEPVKSNEALREFLDRVYENNRYS